MATARATGHVRVLDRKGGPVFYAKLKLPLPDGTVYEPQRRLGRVWSKRSRPPAGYLTRAQAEARLAAILAGDDPLVNVEPSHVTFRQACEERLRYLEHDRQRKRSTVNDYRNVIAHDLLPRFGQSTPVEAITTQDVDAFKDELLERVSHRTAQKILVILLGVMSRAKRKTWITTNPCDNTEKVSIRRSDEFNVLTSSRCMRCTSGGDGVARALFVTAAFTGLRMGELLALRWRHIDFANRILHVQRNCPTAWMTRRSAPAPQRPAFRPGVVALDALSRREHFTGPEDLVFGTSSASTPTTTTSVRGSTRRSRAPGSATCGPVRADRLPRPAPYVRHAVRREGHRHRQIQAWMGHADIQTTKRYMHYVPQHDDAARLTAAFTAETMPPTVPRTGGVRA